jgi:hypothetical protein
MHRTQNAASCRQLLTGTGISLQHPSRNERVIAFSLCKSCIGLSRVFPLQSLATAEAFEIGLFFQVYRVLVLPAGDLQGAHPPRH